MTFWTKEKTQQLEELWKRGLSASEIKDKIHAASRSAVLGKVHRMGLPYRVEMDGRPSDATRKKISDAQKKVWERKKQSDFN